IVLVPIVLGVVLRKLIPGVIERCLDVLPLISVLGITLVVVGVVAANVGTPAAVGISVVIAALLHTVPRYGLGYGLARLCRLERPGRRAVAIEVGMQNSGLSAALATAHFNPIAALPAAVFSVWHNISGSLLAGYWSHRGPVEDTERTD